MPASASSQASATASSSDRPLRILIVEDHEDSARMLARLFEMKGHTTFGATTLAEARETCLNTESLDLMLCDLSLPDGDGCELADLARARGTKAIALTGCGMPSDIDRARAAGFSAHLLKPIEFDALETAMATVLGSGS